jgi:hypothetical protein
MTVRQYNSQQMVKYQEACQRWEPLKGGFPCVSMYLFYTNRGNERQSGYILVYDRGARWARTKKELMKYNSITGEEGKK